MDYTAARQVWDVVRIGAICRNELNNARVKLLLDLVEALICVTTAQDDDDESRVSNLL